MTQISFVLPSATEEVTSGLAVRTISAGVWDGAFSLELALSQPQLNLNLTQLSWVSHDDDFEHPLPTPPKLNFNQYRPQSNI